jgi:hypothetical protein
MSRITVLSETVRTARVGRPFTKFSAGARAAYNEFNAWDMS